MVVVVCSSNLFRSVVLGIPSPLYCIGQGLLCEVENKSGQRRKPGDYQHRHQNFLPGYIGWLKK